MTIPPHNLNLALRALVLTQVQPMNSQQLKRKAYEALDALRPDLAMKPPLNALAELGGDLTKE